MASPELERGSGTVAGADSAILIACVLLFAFSINLLWKSASAAVGIDYYQVWVAGQAVRSQSVADIYSRDADATLTERYLNSYRQVAPSDRHRAVANKCRELGLTGTPFLYASLGWLAGGEYDRDYRQFQFISVAGLAASIAIFGRLLRVSTPVWLVVGAVLANWFAPILSDTMVGNVGRVQLLLLAAAAWLLGRRRGAASFFAGGVVLGCAVLFKPNIGLVAVALATWWGVNRDIGRLMWTAGGVVVGAIAAVATSAAFFGSARCWVNWFEMIRHLQERYQPTTTMGNFGLAELLRSGLGRDVSTVMLVCVILALAAGLYVARRRRIGAAGQAGEVGQSGDAAETVLVIGIGGAAWLLSTWLVWLHYHTLLVPLILFAAGGLPAGRGRAFGLCMRLAAATALVTWNQILLETFGKLDTRSWAIASVGATVLLVGVAFGGLMGGRSAGAAASSMDSRQRGG